MPDKPRFSTDVPTPARMYDYALGGKDNFAVDRAAVLALNERFPEGLDAARANRLFLYRVVRYLARDAGIRQFLDMGSGLPTQSNVHQVAQEFQPDARVVYVDNDPIVLAHGRALLADEKTTTVITADMTEPRTILSHPDAARLLDFDQPVAALFVSVPHSIPNDDVVRTTLATVMDALAPGSHLAVSQFTGATEELAREHSEKATEMGLGWETRTAERLQELMPDLTPVEPGFVDVTEWRPDPGQPPLSPAAEPLWPYLGAAEKDQRVKETGVVLRKP